MKSQLLFTLWLLSVLCWIPVLMFKIMYYLYPVYNWEMNVVVINNTFWYSFIVMLILSIFLFTCTFLVKKEK